MTSIGSENTTTTATTAKSFGVEGVMTPAPSFERHSAAAAAAAAAAGETSFKPRPPKITVDEDRPAGRHPPSKSPGLCLLRETTSFSDPATTSVLPERRHSYQIPVSTDNHGEDDDEDSRGPKQASSSSSVCCYRRRKSRTEEPYVFALSQAAGRTLDHRRGSAPAVGSVTTATSPEPTKSGFQKATSPPSFQEKQQRTGKPVKHHSPRGSSSSDQMKSSSCVEGYATSAVFEDWLPPRSATHSRWSTRALSLPASEHLVPPSSRATPREVAGLLLPRDGGVAREEEGETGSGSRQSSSLLACPAEETPYRRRSVSHLEAISEESGGGGGGGQKTAAVRRFSIPSRPPNDP